MPRRLHLAFSLVVALVAFGAMDSFEFVRESVRKPYIIENYLYANSLYSSSMPGDGGFTSTRSTMRASSRPPRGSTSAN
jgi:hypothetical protein